MVPLLASLLVIVIRRTASVIISAHLIELACKIQCSPFTLKTSMLSQTFCQSFKDLLGTSLSFEA